MAEKPVWLPNLVGGVSMWKLAPDLNEPKFMDGRLLVPETEGSDSLPSKVRWDVAGLVPLRAARATWPEEVAAAQREFVASLERVRGAFAIEASGYARYRDAFTVPSLDADDGGNYFYSPRDKKLNVINWGASPRAIAGSQELVFGYERFGEIAKEAAGAARGGGGVAVGAAAVGGALAGATVPGAEAGVGVGAGAGAGAGAGLAVAANEAKNAQEAKRAAEPQKRTPWWAWVLVVLGALAVLLFALVWLRACHSPLAGGDSGVVDGAALADGAVAADAQGAGDAAGDGAKGDAQVADAQSDGAAPADAAADARASGDGGKDAGKGDGGGAGAGGAGGGGGDGARGGGGAGKGGGGVIFFKVVPKGGGAPIEVAGDQLPHRQHYHPDALRWRVDSGQNQLVDGQPATGEGDTFDVYLKPDGTFHGVSVSWQDKNGKWHR